MQRPLPATKLTKLPCNSNPEGEMEPPSGRAFFFVCAAAGAAIISAAINQAATESATRRQSKQPEFSANRILLHAIMNALAIWRPAGLRSRSHSQTGRTNRVANSD